MEIVERTKADMVTSYTLDRDNRIICLGGSWDDFALKNDGSNAMAEKVIGHSLWNFVEGFEVQSFLNAIFFAVRQKNQPFSTLYRCDTSNKARLFKMTATPNSLGHVHVGHQLIEPPRIAAPSSVMTLDSIMCSNRCSMCCSFKVDEEWVDPFAYPETEFFPYSHVICPSCKALAREGLGEVVQMQPLRKLA